MNASFITHIQQYVSNPTSMNLFALILKDKLKQTNTNGKAELEKIAKDIAKQKMRLKNAKDMMLDGEFSSTEYKEMKIDAEVSLICNVGGVLKGKQNGKDTVFSKPSHQVIPIGLTPYPLLNLP